LFLIQDILTRKTLARLRDIATSKAPEPVAETAAPSEPGADPVAEPVAQEGASSGTPGVTLVESPAATAGEPAAEASE